MSQHYRNYLWKNGIPYGIDSVDDPAPLAKTYKIPMDPYRKRIVVEEWGFKRFLRVIYDSAFLDFRHLQPSEQTAWEKVVIEENRSRVVSEIRNQDDRMILIETYQFENGFCRLCLTNSAHGIPISEQRLFYTALGDPCNGVLLVDSSKRPVMFKSYACDDSTGEFTDLIKEEWDMTKPLSAGLGVINA